MSEIWKGAKAGTFLGVEGFVQDGGDVNAKNSDGDTILHYAAQSGSLEIVKYLVEHGADVNCKTKKNESVLHYAARSRSLEIVKYLVEHGADVNSKIEKRFSILHYATRYDSLEIVKYLVENGAKVTMEECKGDQTVLFEAVNRGNDKTVDYLLSHGAVKDIYECDRSGRSFLSTACYLGNIALVQTLLKYKVGVRREKTLVCRNLEMVNIINMELKKSIKHREKFENLIFLDDEKLEKVSHFMVRSTSINAKYFGREVIEDYFIILLQCNMHGSQHTVKLCRTKVSERWVMFGMEWLDRQSTFFRTRKRRNSDNMATCGISWIINLIKPFKKIFTTQAICVI